MREMKNTIVMMFDSWQFNYTGCYGNDWIKTPNFDRFAREGVLFENGYGNNMPTIPVRRSMMTGRFTLPEVGWAPLRPEDTTIADLCWGTGIQTAMAYDPMVMFCMKYGFSRGYAKAIFAYGYTDSHYAKDPLYHLTVDQWYADEGYLDRVKRMPDGDMVLAMNRAEYNHWCRDKQYWKSEEDQTVAVNLMNAIELLERMDRTHPFHLWIDSWDPHEPWDPPSVWEPGMSCPYDPDYKGVDMWLPAMGPIVNPETGEHIFTDAQLNHIRMLYAENVTLCDKYFGKLMDAVRRLGYEQNTLIWLTSDHGEPMGEGKDGHGIMTKIRPWPYEELVHIPLIIRYPGCPADKHIKAFVQDCDCAPTLLEWMGLPIPPTMTGKSLLPLMRGEVEKVRDFAIAGYYGFSWSIITDDWSYIHWKNKLDYTQKDEQTKEYALYNFISEAGEKTPEQLEYEQRRSVDGEAQWTCTPGSKAELHSKDELYDRHADPFQLNNVIDEHPEIAAQLKTKLFDFIDDIKEVKNAKIRMQDIAMQHFMEEMAAENKQ